MERIIDRGNSILTPEQIEKIDWIVFDTKKGAPFNLTVFLDPYIFEPKSEQKKQLVESLLDPSIMEPYYRWQFCRRVINPLWSKGSGFEGHLVGLSQKEILKTLREEEDYLTKSARKRGYFKQLERFIHNVNQPVNLKLAVQLKTDFEVILAKMRAIRSKLQSENSENKTFQDVVYNNYFSPENRVNLDGNSLVIGFSGFEGKKRQQSQIFGDIRHEFPYLAEIGRFGFPPFRVLVHYLSKNYQI